MIVERNLPLVSIITASLHLLQGDATKAKTIPGWKPEVAFQDLTGMMVKADLEQTERAPAKARGTEI
jgi:GDP-D-mannose dehydratase